MEHINPFSPPGLFGSIAKGRLQVVLRLFAIACVIFAVYTVSYGPWVAIGSRYYVPGGYFIHHVFYGPLHFFGSHFRPYGLIVNELFWWGYGPV